LHFYAFSASFLLARSFYLTIPLLHGCGNIEFDVNFMKPTIIIYDASNLKNFSITDTMDLQNPMKVTMHPTTAASVMIDTFNKPLCTKRLLLDVCQVQETAESIRVQVEVEQSVCYVDMEKYGGSVKVQKEAVECALTDYL
jgi:mannose/fructose/N-acetylgalactosamine-specific phosphotransferase system component IIB